MPASISPSRKFGDTGGHHDINSRTMKPALCLTLILASLSLQAATPEVTVIATDKGARLEHRLGDGTARFASNTKGRISGDDRVTLERGLTLISSDSGFLRRDEVTVVTPQGEISVRGTALIAVLPDGSIKVTCLEGRVKTHLAGQSQSLTSGSLMFQPKEGAARLAEIDLTTLRQSCALLGKDFQPLAHSSAIDKAAQHQAGAQPSRSSLLAVRGDAATLPDQSNASGAQNMIAVAAAFSSPGQLDAASSSSGLSFSSASMVSSFSSEAFSGSPFSFMGGGLGSPIGLGGSSGSSVSAGSSSGISSTSGSYGGSVMSTGFFGGSSVTLHGSSTFLQPPTSP